EEAPPQLDGEEHVLAAAVQDALISAGAGVDQQPETLGFGVRRREGSHGPRIAELEPAVVDERELVRLARRQILGVEAPETPRRIRLFADGLAPAREQRRRPRERLRERGLQQDSVM